jgi:phthiocerol/phenolphthiocerol synthesis type-I polyketide synthase E
MTQPAEVENEIAIIGMAGRFPGAANLEQFWANLRDGVESIRCFSAAELLALGVDAAALAAPNYVRAAPVVDGIDLFDAAFFGYSPREAAMLDPQQRLLLECAWEALEDAGYAPGRIPGLVGVYAGTSMSSYLLFNLLPSPEIDAGEDSFQLMIGTDKDFVSTRISYHLDLRGPSLDVQTGCSTSLVATYLACEALLGFQCDLALAGGVSLQVPRRWGYHHEPGGVASPDGHCRAFDDDAAGTIFGSGAGMVVLKRLGEALADGDRIGAVIKGAAVNNDGSLKIGFTAPGMHGQAEAIARAQAMAQVDPATITYVEAHGTGTPFGDPVEVAALAKVFAAATGKRGFCGLGSVKTNIGHLDAAAGIAGLIKTVLALTHRQLPPSLHFRRPNRRIDFAASPFYVVDRLAPWACDSGPRRAGVSSFGIGGTNAHLVLEEAPAPPPAAPPARPLELLPLSARTAAALADASSRLAARLRAARAESAEGAERAERAGEDRGGPAALADVAYTLQVGRKRFAHRRVVLAAGGGEAAAALESLDRERVWDGVAEQDERPLAFLFPGGGTQHVGMGRELHRGEPVFLAELERCAESLARQAGLDLLGLLYPEPGELSDLSQEAEAVRRMTRPALALPALFSVEYALARQLMHWGLRPQAVAGHSLGEYVAACLAGVFSLADALALVVLRGRLFEQLPAGAMLSVPLAEAEVRRRIDGDGGLSLAAVNGPAQCVVAGAGDALERLAAALAGEEIESRRIQIDVAAHSHLVEPVLGQFRAFVERLELRPPGIPLLSNVTGTWMTAAEACDPGYWTRQLRQTVRFGDAVGELLADPERALVEIGPGRALSTLAQLQAGPRSGRIIVPAMRHPLDRTTDLAQLLGCVGRLWAAGATVDWAAFQGGAPRRRVALPAYPWQRRRHWIEPPAGGRPARGRPGKRADVDGWFYLPAWRRTLPLAAPAPAPAPRGTGNLYLLLGDGLGVADQLARRIVELGGRVILAPGDGGREVVPANDAGGPAGRAGKPAGGSGGPASGSSGASDLGVVIAVGAASGAGGPVLGAEVGAVAAALLDDLAARGEQPAAIVHLRSLTGDGRDGGTEDFQRLQETGFYSLLGLLRTLDDRDGQLAPPPVLVVTDRLQQVESGDRPLAAKATLLGPCLVGPQEIAGLRVRCVEVQVAAGRGEAGDPGRPADLVERLQAELDDLRNGTGDRAEPQVALRRGMRWVRHYEPIRLAAAGPEPATPLATGATPAPEPATAAFTRAPALAQAAATAAPTTTSAPVPVSAPAPSRLRQGGVYLLTGGLGGIGLELAGYLAREARAKLVLVSRTPLPRRGHGTEQDKEEDAAGGLPEPAAGRLRRLREIEAAGGEVLALAADVSDPRQLRAAVERAEAAFGRLDGVVHLAGSGGEHSVRLIGQLRAADCEEQLAGKARGALALERALAGRRLDFCLLFSSNAAVLGGLGGAAYAAANLVLDALAERQRDGGGTPWISAAWDGWLLGRERLGSVATSLDRHAMTTAESLEAFRRVVERLPAGRVVVSTGDLEARLGEAAAGAWVPPAAGGARGADRGIGGDFAEGASRRTTPYAAPADALEERVAAVWRELLGIDDLGAEDNFFDLGGNSLLGLRLVSRLKRELGREIAMVKLFEGPTVRAFAALLREDGDSAAAAPAAGEPAQLVSAAGDRGARRRQLREGEGAAAERRGSAAEERR